MTNGKVWSIIWTSVIIGVAMIIRTRIFELCNGDYRNLSELAQVMGISVSQIYRVREGKRNINRKFIIGATNAFPEYKLDELFYLASELPNVTSSSLSLDISKRASNKIKIELAASTK